MNNEFKLPHGWATARLDQLFVTITDGDHQAPPQSTKGVPFIVIGNIRDGSIDFSRVRFVPWTYYESLPSQKRPKRGDLLYTVTGSFGIPLLVRSDDEFCVQRHIAILKPAEGTNARYVGLALSTIAALHQATEVATGTAQKTVGLAPLRSLTVPLAPTEEQHRIVETLESLLSRVDAAISSLKRAQAKLKAYRASVLKAAVEGRLVPTEAELARKEGCSYEPAGVLLTRILEERRRCWEDTELGRMKATGKSPRDDKWKGAYREPATPETSALPSLPEGWCWTSCDQLLEKLQTGPFGSSLHKSDYVTGGTPVINPEHLRQQAIHPSDQITVDGAVASRLSAFRLVEGDVVLGRRGEMGRCAVAGSRENGWLLGTGSLALRPAAALNPSFLAWVLRSPRSVRALSREAVGTTMANLNQEILLGLAVPLPPLSEQLRIVDEIERQLSLIENLERRLASQKERCDRGRQAILKWAFEGRLVDQDSTEEPAAALLARIRAERAAAAPVKPQPKQPRARRLKEAS